MCPLSIEALVLELSLLLAAWLVLAALQKDRATPGRVGFALLALAGATWGFAELADQRAVFSEQVVDRIRYAGALAVPGLWLGVACHAARLDIAARVPWFPVMLLVPSAMLYALMYSPTWGPLFVTVMPGGPNEYGPLWWAANGYAHLLVGGGSLVLVAAAFRRGRFDAQAVALVLGACAPLAAHVAYAWSSSEWPLDPTPLAFVAGFVALRSALFSGGILQLLPVAQLDVVQQLPFGVVLTDTLGTVLWVNPAAEERLGLPGALAIGRALDSVLAESRGEHRVDSVPLRSAGGEAGCIVLLDAPKRRA